MKVTPAGFEKSVRYLTGEFVKRLDGVIRGYAPQRLPAVFGRPFAQALLPLAISSRVWRTGRLDGAAGIFGVEASVATSAIDMSIRVARTPTTFCVSPSNVQALGSRLTGKRQRLRRLPANVGRLDVFLAAPNDVPGLMSATTSSLRKLVDDYPFGVACASALATILVHPFDDGNGRTARALPYLICRPVLGRNHVPMSIALITQPAMNLLRTLDASVACGDFSALEKLVERSSRSWRDLCVCVSEQVEGYEEECRLAFGRSLGRCQSILVGRVQISDLAFANVLRGLRGIHERRKAESMFRLALVNEETVWINRRLIERLECANKLIYRTL